MSAATPTPSAHWNYPTSMDFGAGSIKTLARACATAGVSRPLLVTDQGTAGLPFTHDIIDMLQADGLPVSLFSEVAPNPATEHVSAGVSAYQRNRCNGVIALGGGSGLDAAKTIALMAGQTRPLADFEDIGDNWQRVDEAGMAPCIAIPTTAGTGSEVGRAAVIVDSSARRKTIIFHPNMMPQHVICDPELCIGLPPGLTAATGIDAFTHCFEAYCAPAYHPMADGIALQGMELVARWLPAAFDDGGDIEARSHMLAASSMGAVAFQKGLGAVHAISHSVGAQYDVHHGLTNAIFLPYVMVRNRSAIEQKMQRLAVTLGLQQPGFDSVLDWVLQFRERLGIPHDANALGVRQQDLDMLAEKSAADAALGGNPLELDAAALKHIISKALSGDV